MRLNSSNDKTVHCDRTAGENDHELWSREPKTSRSSRTRERWGSSDCRDRRSSSDCRYRWLSLLDRLRQEETIVLCAMLDRLSCSSDKIRSDVFTRQRRTSLQTREGRGRERGRREKQEERRGERVRTNLTVVANASKRSSGEPIFSGVFTLAAANTSLQHRLHTAAANTSNVFFTAVNTSSGTPTTASNNGEHQQRLPTVIAASNNSRRYRHSKCERTVVTPQGY